MNRTDRIRADLDRCVQKGIIRDYYVSSPDGRKRWVVMGIGFNERVFTTREVEAFTLGATEGRTTGLMDGRFKAAPGALVRECMGRRM